MKNLMDLHCHTLACGHAYSTARENILEAKDKGLKVIGLSEHGYGMGKMLSPLYFLNQKVIPEYCEGVRVLKGIEANIIDYDGNIAEQDVLEYMDYCIASLHKPCIKPGSRIDNTMAVIGAINNPCVSIIGHLDDSYYPVDYRAIVKELKYHNVSVELNNSSLKPTSFRLNCRENYMTLLELCAIEGVHIIMSSDSHFYKSVGDLELAIELLEEIDFPDELVVNYDLNKLQVIINSKI